MNGVITLLTDFGDSSHYPAVMKAVILSRCPGTVMVDITHKIPAFDVRAAAFVLSQVIPQFRMPAVHLVVVDPGVGTQREAIAVKTDNNTVMVGPNNGVFSWVLRGKKYVTRKLPIPEKSSMTFHGRDVFAPAAADLYCGRFDFDELPPSTGLLEIPFPGFTTRNRGLETEILFKDSFGNILLPIPQNAGLIPVGTKLHVQFREQKRTFSYGTYGNIRPGGLCWHYDSSGFLELAVAQGSLAQTTGIGWDDKLFLVAGES